MTSVTICLYKGLGADETLELSMDVRFDDSKNLFENAEIKVQSVQVVPKSISISKSIIKWPYLRKLPRRSEANEP